MAIPFFGISLSAEAPKTENAENIFFYCINNGATLYEKASEVSFAPSSLTKMMTGLIACERLSDRLEEKITVTSSMLSGASGDRMNIVVDETMPIKDLIYGLICCGYNDCATALAVCISGSAESFTAEMNKRAAELQMNATLYTTPTGSETLISRTTATDTASLALACADNPLYLKIASTAKHKVSATNKSGAVNIYNKNYLVSQYKNPKYYNSDFKGVFAADTGNGLHSVAAYAEHGDMRYICVVANAKSTDSSIYSYSIATELLKWAYKQFDYVNIVKATDVICSLPVTMSAVIKETAVYPEENVTMFIPSDSRDDVVISYRLNYASLKAPIKAGDAVGYLTVTYNSQTETVRLVTAQDIEASGFLSMIDSISELSQSRVFKAALTCTIVLSIAAIFVEYKIKKRRAEYTHLKRK